MARDYRELFWDVDRGSLCEAWIALPSGVDSSSSEDDVRAAPTITATVPALYAYSGYVVRLHLSHSDGTDYDASWATA